MIRTKKKTTHFEKIDNDEFHVQITKFYVIHERMTNGKKHTIKNSEHIMYNCIVHDVKRATIELGGY